MHRRPKRLAALLLAAVAVFFSASAPLSAEDLSGKWLFSFYTDDGVVPGTLELVQDDHSLTAKFDASTLKGVATSEEFTLAGDYFAPTAGYEGALLIKGKQDGDKLSGSATWDVYALTFTAVRAE